MSMLVNFGVYWSCLLEIFVLDVHANRARRVRGGGKRAFLATAIFLAMKEFRLARPATCEVRLSNTNTTRHYVS